MCISGATALLSLPKRLKYKHLVNFICEKNQYFNLFIGKTKGYNRKKSPNKMYG